MLSTLAVIIWAVTTCKTFMFGPFIYFSGEKIPLPPSSPFPENVIGGSKEPVFKFEVMLTSGLAFIQGQRLRPVGNEVVSVTTGPLFQGPPTVQAFHFNPGFVLPHYHHTPFDIDEGRTIFFSLQIPFWTIFALCASVTLVAFRKSHVRFKEYQCRQCGYNLTGNTSGKCPECGTRMK